MRKVLDRKAQSAVEFLMVVSLALLLIIPAASLVFSDSAQEKQAIEANQMAVIGNTLLLTAQEMHVMAPGSYIKLEVRVPDSLTSVMLNAAGPDKSDLVFTQRTPYGDNDIVIFSEDILFTVGPTETNICLSEKCNATGIYTGTNFIKLYHNPEGAIRIEGAYTDIPVSCTRGTDNGAGTGYCAGTGLCVKNGGQGYCMWDCQPPNERCSDSTANYHSGHCKENPVSGKNYCD